MRRCPLGVVVVSAVGIAVVLAMPSAANAAWNEMGVAAAGDSELPIEAQCAVSAAIGADDSTYHAQTSEAGLVLTNAGHGVRLTFGDDDEILRGETFVWRIGLRSWGYRDARRSAEGGVSVVCGNRVELDHGGLTEWYVNGPFGIQQGFTVSHPGERCGGPLVLEVTVPEGVTGVLESDARGLTWCNVDGAPVVRYGDLIAFDARGASLEAWLEVDEEGLRICVDDADALYPLTIDPWVQQAKLTVTDGAQGDCLGHSVAISGDTVVVGAPGYGPSTGAAYVFEKPVGGWATGTETAKLTASDGTMNASFGSCIGIDGDTVVVGAVGDASTKGAAYVFERPADGWTTGTETAKLTASDGVADDQFGRSVSISGGSVIIGASRDDVGTNSNQGSAYVFEKPASGWETGTETAKLTASDGEANDYFGFSAAISGDTVVIGAHCDNIGSNSDQGSAYVFEKPAGGWAMGTETAKLTASDGEASDWFGGSVAISGDTVVAGAYGDDVDTNSNQGSAYVFVKPAGGWTTGTETAQLTASDGEVSDWFGRSVATCGDTVIVGAWGDDSTKGSAYVFEKSVGGWTPRTETAQLTADDGAQQDYFGLSVAIGGGVVVAGAYGDDVTSNRDQGSVYVFALTDTSPEAGDINGDNEVSLLDVRLCHQIAAGAIACTIEQRQQADVDGDGDVDETDAEILAEYVLGVRATLP